MEKYIAVLCLTFIAIVALCSAASINNSEEETASLPEHPCRDEVSSIKREHLENNRYLKDVVLPQCDKHGYYKTLQRNKKGFMCVTTFGFEIKHDEYHGEGPCKRLKRCVRSNERRGSGDHKLISCDSFGYFRPLQEMETEEGKEKICVNVYGQIVKQNAANKDECLNLSISAGRW